MYDWIVGRAKIRELSKVPLPCSMRAVLCRVETAEEGEVTLGAHQRRLSPVVPAGSMDRMARRSKASGFDLMTLRFTDRPMV
jgi:hypothetical protein